MPELRSIPPTPRRNILPGEVGLRNQLRGDGFFTIDTSLSKGFQLPFANHRIRVRWDVFNVTSTPTFNVGGPVQAGRCMQFALRYEF